MSLSFNEYVSNLEETCSDEEREMLEQTRELYSYWAEKSDQYTVIIKDDNDNCICFGTYTTWDSACYSAEEIREHADKTSFVRELGVDGRFLKKDVQVIPARIF